MRIWRWVGITAGGLAVLALGFVGWVYAASEAHYRGFPAPPPFSHTITEDAATVARGEHLAATRGCRGCHGANLEGEIMWGTVVTPNLPAYLHEHGANTVEAALRHGVGHNGRALYSMPSYNFTRMSDEDVAALIAYLSNAPISDAQPQGELAPWHERALGDFMIRFAIALGEDGAIPKYLDRVPALAQQNNADPRIARGEYLAMTSCNECHGFDLRAHAPWPDTAPDLIVVGTYTPEQFTRLMREGIPSSGADLPMMGPVARGRFVHWTDEEVDDLYAYLSDMSQRAIAAESE
ncbi:MAG: cytochrome c [Hyphomonadaceae bacterium]